jgi:hypothetical protein
MCRCHTLFLTFNPVKFMYRNNNGFFIVVNVTGLLLFTTRKSTFSKFYPAISFIALKQSTNVLWHCWHPPLLQCGWTEPTKKRDPPFPFKQICCHPITRACQMIQTRAQCESAVSLGFSIIFNAFFIYFGGLWDRTVQGTRRRF